MSVEINDSEIENRVRGYLGRKDVPTYDLETEGKYELETGILGERGGKKMFDTVKGRFIDAVVYAVQQPEFCGWYCSWNNATNPNHGTIYLREDPQLDKDLGDKLLKVLKGGLE